MRIDRAIRDAADASHALAAELTKVGERHKADHDVHHLARTLARMSADHTRALEPIADRYGTRITTGEPGGPLSKVREKASEMIGSRPESGLLLLRDLKSLYVTAAEASISWTILGQGAQAARDQELLDTVTRCHEECLRVERWVTTRIKAAAPQVVA